MEDEHNHTCKICGIEEVCQAGACPGSDPFTCEDCEHEKHWWGAFGKGKMTNKRISAEVWKGRLKEEQKSGIQGAFFVLFIASGVIASITDSFLAGLAFFLMFVIPYVWYSSKQPS